MKIQQPEVLTEDKDCEIWSISNVAEKLGHNVTTIRKWCRDKKPPCHLARKVGEQWIIPLEIEVKKNSLYILNSNLNEGEK